MNNKLYSNNIIYGDCLNVLKKYKSNSIDFIFTSPPYADSRKHDYGGIHPDKYVEWFLPISIELLRVLKSSGTLVINIKEKVVNTERHTYVIDLILKMREQGWLWTEEYIWHKKNAFPGKWNNRFRDAWERCLQFNKNKKFKMYQDAVKIPIGDWSKTRLKKLNGNDKKRTISNTNSGFGRKIKNWIGKRKVYPDNVLYLPNVCCNKNHSAVFPIDLPRWFIKLFTKEGDIVLDPFIGSGTTAIASRELNRRYIGIEIHKKNYNQAIKSLKS